MGTPQIGLRARLRAVRKGHGRNLDVTLRGTAMILGKGVKLHLQCPGHSRRRVQGGDEFAWDMGNLRCLCVQTSFRPIVYARLKPMRKRTELWISILSSRARREVVAGRLDVRDVAQGAEPEGRGGLKGRQKRETKPSGWWQERPQSRGAEDRGDTISEGAGSSGRCCRGPCGGPKVAVGNKDVVKALAEGRGEGRSQTAA